MRTLFLGYQSVGCTALKTLLELDRPPAAVVTHRDAPGEKIWFPSVAELARGAGVPVSFAEDLGSAGLEALARDLAPNLLLSVYYRSLVPARVLRLAARGGVNLHGSLLPAYRGRAPANWVLVNGESRTGVTLHEMTAKADAGAIVAQREIPIAPRETIVTLYAKINEAAAALLREWVPRLERGDYPRLAQDESRASYYGGRRPEDGRIDWTAGVRKADCLVRALTDPFPGAFTLTPRGKLILWEGAPDGPAQGPSGSLRAEGESLLISASDGTFRAARWTWEGAGDLRASAAKGEIQCES